MERICHLHVVEVCLSTCEISLAQPLTQAVYGRHLDKSCGDLAKIKKRITQSQKALLHLLTPVMFSTASPSESAPETDDGDGFVSILIGDKWSENIAAARVLRMTGVKSTAPKVEERRTRRPFPFCCFWRWTYVEVQVESSVDAGSKEMGLVGAGTKIQV